MGETQVVSKKFSWNKYDWLKGALLAAAAPVLDYLIEAFMSGGFKDVDWKHVLAVGLSAGMVYMKMTFFTTSTTTIKK